MINIPDPKDLVAKIRKAAADRDLSINDIITQMKEKGEYPVAPATISRLLSGDPEEYNYDYLKTIIPIYNTLFDFDEIKDENETFQAMKLLLEYKKEVIVDLERQLESAKENYQNIIDFRSDQLKKKDELISQLSSDLSKMIDHMTNCPYKGKCE